MLVLAREIQFLDVSNTVFIIVSLERHGSAMEEDSEGVLFVQPSITISEALVILQHPPETCITAPPQKPKAGQVFLYKADNAGKQGNITNN